MNRRGGKRAGAGRRKMFDLMTIMALHWHVKEKQRGNKRLSKTAALISMQNKNELPEGPIANYLRYLTPKYLNVGIRFGLALLKKREGIAASIRIPPSLKHTPRKNTR